MRLLFLTQNLPYPPNSGGRIKTFKTLQLLSRHHRIFLVCFAKDQQELGQAKELEKLGITVFPLVFAETALPFREMRAFMVKSLWSKLPFLVYRHQHQKMRDIISQILERESIEAIHVDHLVMAQYLPKKKDQVWVYDEHNLDSEINWQIFQKERWNKFKAFSLLEWTRMVMYERHTIPQFDYWLTISQHDRKKLIKLGTKKNRTFFYPVFFEPWQGKKRFPQKKSLLFMGTLSWWPNRDGLEWFVTRVFPLVTKQFPELRIEVIGKDDTRDVSESLFENSRIHWHGYVTDIRPFLRKAWGCILPLRAGSGVRIKAFTALAAGLPVISTRKGIEGVHAGSQDGVLVGDTPEEFASAIRRLVAEEPVRKQLSQAGKQFIRNHYSQRKAEQVLERIYVKS